jgi:hypothetical protein
MRIAALTGTVAAHTHWFDAFRSEANQCAGKSATGITIPAISI